MKPRRPLGLSTGLLILALLGTPTAHADPEIDALRAQMKAMQAELDALKHDRLAEARSEALADAQRRVTFESQPLRSGHNGKNFVITSPAGDFSLIAFGQLQYRFVSNTNSTGGTEADGFEFRRIRIGVKGTLDRGTKLGYLGVADVNRSTGVLEIEDAQITYQATPKLRVALGQNRLPFARQELIGNTVQLGADRSVATEYFTLDRSQGVWFDYQASGQLGFRAAISDGADNGFSGSGSSLAFESDGDDDADLAMTTRVDYAVTGKGNAATDVVAWRGDDPVLLVGAAGHLNFAQRADNFYAATADVLYKKDGLSGLGAVYVLLTDDNSLDIGLTLEGGYNIDDTWQPFARFDYAQIDGAGDDLVSFGGGVNWFINKHDAKFTADAIYVTDLPSSGGRTPNTPGGGIGLVGGASDQVVVRAQFQLLF